MHTSGPEAVQLSGADPAGRLYFDGHRYLRGIYSTAASSVTGLFDCGLFAELYERGMVPSTRIATEIPADNLRGFSLILEHEAIHPITYPREWGFEMVKAAALAFLDVVELSLRHNYICKDAHLFNFVFHGSTPVWVDLTSLTARVLPDNPLPWRMEFSCCVTDPLKLWSDGCEFLARRSISHPAMALPADEFIAYRYPMLRGSSSLLWKARSIFGRLRYPEAIKSNSRIAALLKFVSRRRTDKVIRSLRSAIVSLQSSRGSTWGDYHSAYLSDAGDLIPSQRFQRILTLVAEYNPDVVTELAGNAGVLSQLLAKRHPEKLVICTDYDPRAIDCLFDRARRSGLENLAFAVLDFMVPEYSTAEIPPQQRLGGDCVLALAVTHHLLLSQGYSYDDVFLSIASYTRKYAFIEFMPLGLHDGEKAPPLPDWYSLDAFKKSFSKYFACLHIEQLEENRILFLGELLPRTN